MHPLIEIGALRLPTYILIISLTYCFAMIWVVKRAEARGMDRHMTLDICLAIMIGGFIGARLLHIVYEAPDYYVEKPLRMFEVWRGGFVFYGGVIGGLLANEWLFRKRGLEKGPWQDLFAPVLPLAYAFGRLSCVAAGCCFGHETDLPWGITFPAGVEATPHIPLHPTQFYAFFWEVLLFLGILFIERRKRSFPKLSTPGTLFFLWLMGHAIGRFIMEAFRADHRGDEIFGLSISSAISLVIFAVAALIFREKRRNWTLYAESTKIS